MVSFLSMASNICFPESSSQSVVMRTASGLCSFDQGDSLLQFFFRHSLGMAHDYGAGVSRSDY